MRIFKTITETNLNAFKNHMSWKIVVIKTGLS